jgi:thioredoxin reductase
VTGPLPEHVRVAVIGAGRSGLGAGIRLRLAGLDRTGAAAVDARPAGRAAALGRGPHKADGVLGLDEYQLIQARS